MGDTIDHDPLVTRSFSGLTRSAFVAACVALAGCGESASLVVTVTHPSNLTVASTTVSVYVSSQFTCQDIEYGNVDSASLQAALVASESVGLGTPFDPIALAERHGQRRNPAFFAQLLLGTDSPNVPLDELGSARQALTRLLASPEAQCI